MSLSFIRNIASYFSTSHTKRWRFPSGSLSFGFRRNNRIGLDVSCTVSWQDSRVLCCLTSYSPSANRETAFAQKLVWILHPPVLSKSASQYIIQVWHRWQHRGGDFARVSSLTDMRLTTTALIALFWTTGQEPSVCPSVAVRITLFDKPHVGQIGLFVSAFEFFIR